MIVDLQVNVDAKDGAPTDPAQLAKAAKTAGLDGIVLTREGVLSFDATPYMDAGRAEGLTVFSGAKVATNHGLLLCLFPEDVGVVREDFAARENGIYDVAGVIDAVERMGGVSVALRPYDRVVERPMGDHIFSFQGLTACDVQNASVPRQDNDLALEAASSLEIPCVGASSSFGPASLGTAATLFRQAVSSHRELCEAIRNGDCWPVTFSASLPPDTDERSPDRGGGRGAAGARGQPRGGRRDQGHRGGAAGRGPRRDDDGRRRGGRRGGDRRGPAGRPEGSGGRGVPSRPRRVDEDAGNRVDSHRDHAVDDDIGNRLAPGEASPYRPGARPSDEDPGNA